ncbi:hypothetical protein EOD42_16860 [Rhodovarius crocodyli]|uniref:Phage tail lysozyme domain-containing protein n=1 Tax=Rhodovarius crocodyli TaxID=1979269 RepID=A0A437MC82_9PROT|nr:phage tail tip lysozyme [Rhodovarius crocodyli]RVT95254.1 hypothetical protein EOD42_16860 [Rhodovarius crocodyli]
MASIIDALVVTLNLDPKGFKQGEREAGQAQRRMREDATRTQKEIEEVGKRVTQSLNTARNAAIGLFAVFIGGRGISSFVRETSEGSAALGRLSRDLGITTERLSAWEGVSRRVGNTANEVTGAFQNIQDRIQQARLLNNPGAVAGFMNARIALADGPNGERPRTTEAIYEDVLRYIARAPRAERLTRAQSMGFGQETVNLALAPNRAQMMREEAPNQISRQQVENATRLREALIQLDRAVASTARQILDALSPAITALLTKVREFVQYLGGDQFVPYLNQARDGIKRFADYLMSDEFFNDLKSLKDSFGELAQLIVRVLRFLRLIPDPDLTPEEQAAEEARLPRGITGQLPGAAGTTAPAGARPEPPRPGATTDRQRQAYDYFISRGWTPAQAAGIVGHLTGESGADLDTNAFNPAGGGRGAMGIGQWRGQRIAEFERQYGRTPQGAPLEMQLAFVDWELRNTERAQGDALRATTDPREAADLIFRRYGRPGAEDRTGPRRQSNALGIYQQFNRPVAPPVPDPALMDSTRPGAAVQNKMWGGSSVSNETAINGPITVNTQATDANGIARDIGAALKRHAFVDQVTLGLA